MTREASSQAAPYCILYDARGDEDLLDNQMEKSFWNDSHPSDETLRIYRGRAALLQRLDTTSQAVTIGGVPTLWQSVEFAVPPDLVHAESTFLARKPERIDHHEPVWSPNPHNFNDMYMVVSPDWKAAIESVEPGVHEFFPHMLRFKDGSCSDRFIFRYRTVVYDCLRPAETPILRSKPFGLLDRLGREIRPIMDLDTIGGRHWMVNMSQGMQSLILVSRALAMRLEPLLPRFNYFWPSL